MQEITRIHIAKISYDIEVTAKKELEKYTTKLELYADDPNLLEDIEIRITEILSSRGIERGGVIASDDIKAIRKQLGEPKDFIGDGDTAIDLESFDDDSKPVHRLYRDKDSAILGGVLSGIAKYFGINPTWTRLLFIVAGLASWGLVIIAYVVLWIVTPVAKTATEKLQLTGKQVTLASIKELSEQDDVPNNAPRILQNSIIYTAGTLAAIGAAGALATTLWAGGFLLWGSNDRSSLREFAPDESMTSLITYIGFVLAGLLLTTLLSLLAYALFRKTWTKKLTVSTIVIVIAGVISFGGGISSFVFGEWQYSTSAYDSRSTDKVALPSNFENVKELTVDIGTVDVDGDDVSNIYTEYIVSSTSRYEVSAVRGTMKPNIIIEGNKAILTLSNKEDRRNRYVQPTLTIYGPTLDKVTVKSGSIRYYNKDRQDVLTAITESSETRTSNNYQMLVGGNFEVAGQYGIVDLTTHFSSSATLSGATVENLNANMQGGYIAAGVVRSLNVQQVDVCPADIFSSQNSIVVRGITSGKLTYNGSEQAARSIHNDCGKVIIGDENELETQTY